MKAHRGAPTTALLCGAVLLIAAVAVPLVSRWPGPADTRTPPLPVGGRRSPHSR
ncbi:MAG: hypothetical protein WDN28_17560 [Chthoniobacter sp.]